MPFAEKRGNGPYPWRVRFRRPDKPDGSHGGHDSASGFATEDDAYNYGLDMESDIRRNRYRDHRKGNELFRDYAARWLKAADLASTSEVSYRSRLKAAIHPRWGDVPVGDINSVLDVRAWTKQIRRQYRGNSPDNIIMVFRMILDDAVTEGLIDFNPVEKKSRRGKVAPTHDDDDEEIIVATPAQVRKLSLNAGLIRPANGETFILTKAYTGMRLGEMRGLLRSDCFVDGLPDWEQYLWVRRQGQYVDGKPGLPPPKYDSGRKILIPPFLAARIAALLESHTSKFVFLEPEGGRMLGGGNFSKYFFRPAADGRGPRKAGHGLHALPRIHPVGVPGLKPHWLRHAHATWLDEAGHPDVAIEARLGHASGNAKKRKRARDVKSTYRHVTPSMERGIVKTLQELWEGSAEAASEASPN